MHSVETVLQILIFSQASDMGYDTLGRAAPSRPHDHKDQQLIHVQPFCTQTTILFFTFSRVFNPLREMVNPLLSSRLCVRRFCPTVG